MQVRNVSTVFLGGCKGNNTYCYRYVRTNLLTLCGLQNNCRPCGPGIALLWRTDWHCLHQSVAGALSRSVAFDRCTECTGKHVSKHWPFYLTPKALIDITLVACSHAFLFDVMYPSLSRYSCHTPAKTETGWAGSQHCDVRDFDRCVIIATVVADRELGIAPASSFTL